MPDSPFDDYLDLVEAAGELGIHPQSLRRLIKQKRVPAVLFAGKYLIERDKLEMFKANYDPRPGRKPHPPPALAEAVPAATYVDARCARAPLGSHARVPRRAA